MVFKGWALGEAVSLLTQAACPALRQQLVQPVNAHFDELSAGAARLDFYSRLATTIACNISTISNNGYRIVREPSAESLITVRILPLKNCCDPEGSYCYY